jgi:putative ABC transport system permease protein
VYPNLLPPLLVIVGALFATVLFIALRHPVSRRLAFRQLSRRRSEAALAIIGSTLGTAIIAGALVVGDTLGASVREAAYRTLGPIDERVLTTNATTGDMVADRLDPLRGNADVDGVLNAHYTDGAAVMIRNGVAHAEPRVLVWGMDLLSAAAFGSANGASGLEGPTPPNGQMVINKPLASALHVHAGEFIELYFFGEDHNLQVARVVPEQGLAGAGLGNTSNRNAFIAPSVLDASAQMAGASPRAMTLVSNRGNVEDGADLTDRVTDEIRIAMGGAGSKALIETPKQDVLDAAKTTGDSLGALFLMIGSFSIIAGALLLVNIFVMLADERKAQLGMLRAVGMKRSEMVGSLTLEGSTYAIAAIVPGTLLGLGVGWTVAQVAAQIFRNFSANGEGLTIRFAVTSTSLVNAAAMGLVIGIVTILITSVRISRFNVIAAIRDLPYVQTRRSRRLVMFAATALAVLTGAAAVPAVAASQGEGTYLLPALTAFLLIPLLRGLIGPRRAITATSAFALVWSLTAPVVRPHMFDEASMAVFVISGSLVTFSAVALVSQNQDAVLAPIRRIFERPGESGLAVRLAVAYPLAKRFRTGATLIMYSLITLVLVLLVEVAGVINGSIDRQVTDASAGYSMRLDFSAAEAQHTLSELRTGEFTNEITTVTPLISAPAGASDPGGRTNEPLRAVVVGVPGTTMSSMAFTKRLDGYDSNAAVWQLVARDPHYVVLDAYFGATGGPAGSYYSPGDTFSVTDPRTGHSRQKTIAGILTNSVMFYSMSGTSAGNTFPIIGSEAWLRDQFGAGAETTAAFVRTAPGVDVADLASRLQGDFLGASLVATPMRDTIRRMFAANIAFFRLMQGFLALGLAIGITGLGVVMVRAVRERRRTIGVLRALGFRARTVERSFLLESGLIAVEGIVLGSVLGVLTTWLTYQKSAMFEGVRITFPIEWLTIGVLCVATVLASLAATLTPARNAARIRPAVAVRVAE